MLENDSVDRGQERLQQPGLPANTLFRVRRCRGWKMPDFLMIVSGGAAPAGLHLQGRVVELVAFLVAGHEGGWLAVLQGRVHEGGQG